MHPRDSSNLTVAVFLDLENIARGTVDAHFPQFDIGKVFERLLREQAPGSNRVTKRRKA